MKKFLIGLGVLAMAIAGIAILKSSSGFSEFLWTASQGGTLLLPLVVFSALLDSVHPCSFSILLITIAFLLGLQMARKKILLIGGIYVAGIFAAYFAIGLGLLKVLHIFSVPHFMGKLGAVMLIAFGLLNLLGAMFPKFPLRLKLPSSAHSSMAKLIDRASIPAVFVLGLLVGLCQFPCMGGPYLMVIGLLHDYGTYFTGFGYLLLYNLILIVPLLAVLWFAADRMLLEKFQEWKKTKMRNVHLWAGIAMVILGMLVFTL